MTRVSRIRAVAPAFLARQPIFDAASQLLGYELLYRDGSLQAAPDNAGGEATARVILNALGHVGLDEISAGRDLYINMTAACLGGDPARLLPPDRVVLEILETAEPGAELLDQCRMLKRAGYRLALDDFVYGPEWEPFLGLADLVKLDIRQLQGHAFTEQVRALRARGLPVLAEKVETVAEFEVARDAGCVQFQGYFLARPELLSGRPLPPSASTLLALLARLREGVDVRSIELEISRDTALLYRLLRFAGAAAFGRYPPRSLREALQRIGERNLERWLMLELYAGASTDDVVAAALLEQAAWRSECMARLAVAAGVSATQVEEAAAVGGFSLLDALFGRPMEELLRGVALPDAMLSALIHTRGPLGVILALLLALETDDTDGVAAACAKLGLDPAQLGRLQQEALRAQARLLAAMRGDAG